MINKKNKIQTTKTECRSSFWASAIRMQNQIESGIGRSFVIEIYGKPILVETNTTLTELHRDIVNAILIHNYKSEYTRNGHFRALFSLKSIHKALNYRISTEKIVEKLKEIKISNFFLSDPNDKKKFTSVHFINKLTISAVKNTDDRLKNLARADYYYFIELDKSYFEFQDYDLKILITNNIVDKIIKVKEASVKKLIYYCLSQNQLNKDLVEILSETSVINQEEMTKQRRSILIKEIISQKDYLLAEFKIEIKEMENSKYGVFYKKNDNVLFENSKQKIPEKLEYINREGQALSDSPSLSRDTLEESLERSLGLVEF